jgi:DNA polymerase-3 subunit alpha
LAISDGLERFELPIWSELFEAKSSLLVENALLLGILQVERREGLLRLGCKWVEDLSTFDETLIPEFQKIFVQKVNSEQKRVVQQEKKMSVEERAPSKTIRVQLNVERVSMSSILEMKRLLQEYPGVEKALLSFECQQKVLGVVTIEGVSVDRALQEKIASLSYATKCLIE